MSLQCGPGLQLSMSGLEAMRVRARVGVWHDAHRISPHLRNRVMQGPVLVLVSLQELTLAGAKIGTGWGYRRLGEQVGLHHCQLQFFS